jgi:hypothetical protein
VRVCCLRHNQLSTRCCCVCRWEVASQKFAKHRQSDVMQTSNLGQRVSFLSYFFLQFQHQHQQKDECTSSIVSNTQSLLCFHVQLNSSHQARRQENSNTHISNIRQNTFGSQGHSLRDNTFFFLLSFFFSESFCLFLSFFFTDSLSMSREKIW